MNYVQWGTESTHGTARPWEGLRKMAESPVTPHLERRSVRDELIYLLAHVSGPPLLDHLEAAVTTRMQQATEEGTRAALSFVDETTMADVKERAADRARMVSLMESLMAVHSAYSKLREVALCSFTGLSHNWQYAVESANAAQDYRAIIRCSRCGRPAAMIVDQAFALVSSQAAAQAADKAKTSFKQATGWAMP